MNNHFTYFEFYTRKRLVEADDGSVTVFYDDQYPSPRPAKLDDVKIALSFYEEEIKAYSEGLTKLQELKARMERKEGA